MESGSGLNQNQNLRMKMYLYNSIIILLHVCNLSDNWNKNARRSDLHVLREVLYEYKFYSVE